MMEVILSFISTTTEGLQRFYEICIESLIWLGIFSVCVLLGLCIGHCVDYVKHDRRMHWGLWGIISMVTIFPIIFIMYGQAEHEMKVYQNQAINEEMQHTAQQMKQKSSKTTVK